MGSIGMVDPNIHLAQVILGLTMVIILYQFLVHGVRTLRWGYTKLNGGRDSNSIKAASPELDSSEVEDNSFLNLSRLFFIAVLRFLLTLVYLVCLFSFLSHFFMYDFIMDVDSYTGRIQQLLQMQLILTLLAVLLRFSTFIALRPFVHWGFPIIVLAVLAKMSIRFLQDSFFHWVQVLELLLPALLLTIIPTISFVAFHYFNQWQRK